MRKINRTEFGASLCLLREMKTQQEVAEKMGITQQQYSRYESGEALPSLEVFINICDVLGITPDRVLTHSLINIELKE